VIYEIFSSLIDYVGACSNFRLQPVVLGFHS
jgi:hypothetical protein